MKFGNSVADIFIIEHTQFGWMRSDLTFLSYIVEGYSFFLDTVYIFRNGDFQPLYAKICRKR